MELGSHAVTERAVVVTLRLRVWRARNLSRHSPYGILGRAMETSASFEARSAPLLYPTMNQRSDVTLGCDKGQSASAEDVWRRRERTQRSEGGAEASFGRWRGIAKSWETKRFEPTLCGVNRVRCRQILDSGISPVQHRPERPGAASTASTRRTAASARRRAAPRPRTTPRA